MARRLFRLLLYQPGRRFFNYICVMKYPTFSQIISGTFALLCLVALVCMYFIKTAVSDSVSGGIVVAFVVAFKDFANAFVKSSSDVQHSDQTKQLIDGVVNSAPITIKAEPEKPVLNE